MVGLSISFSLAVSPSTGSDFTSLSTCPPLLICISLYMYSFLVSVPQTDSLLSNLTLQLGINIAEKRELSLGPLPAHFPTPPLSWA